MQSKAVRIIMGIIAISIALAFFAVPIVKLKEPAMIIVIMIGVVAMIVSFIQSVNEKD